ncbi:MAG: hypothetical protein HOV81_18420 [Kofleriaceae bacterium]|nr:hypothetical protein [Kofleriaceae bacterium]
MQLAARWVGRRTIMLALLAFGATVALRCATNTPTVDKHPTTWKTFEVCSDDYNNGLSASWRTLVPSKHDREVAAIEHCLATTSGWLGDVAYRDGDVVSVRVGRFWYYRGSALESCLYESYREGFLCGGMADPLRVPAHIVWHVAATGD